MEGRRTSGRRKRNEESATAPVEKVSTTSTHINVSSKRSSSKTKVSPSRRTSPGRTRRSSRPRATTLASAPSATTILIRSSPVSHPSPVTEVKETPSPKTAASKTRIPTAVGSNVNTAGRSSPRFTTKSTSSLHSTFSSSSTQKTIEIRSTASALDTDFKKLSDYIRRSVSKTIDGGRRETTHTPTTNTEVESRYSRSVSRSIFDDGASFKAEFSDNETNGGTGEDDEDTDHYKSFNISTQHSYSTSALGKNCRQLEIPKEFGGWAGTTLLMLLIPSIVFYLQWSCHKDRCELIWPKFDFDLLRSTAVWKSIFDNEVVAAYIAFTLGVFVLSAFLCGRYVRLPTDRISGIGGGIQCGAEYKFNALPIAIFITLGAGYAEYLNYPLATFILDHQLRFCIYGFINAFILALWAYLRSDMLKGNSTQAQLNIYGRTGNFLVDYAQGRQLNPKWLNFVEFKLVFYRVALLLTLLYVECYLYKELSLPWMTANESGIWNTLKYYYQNLQYDSAALLSSGMLLAYVLDAIIFEHHLASSFELQGEGFGALLLLRYAATPYLLTAVARYFYLQQLSLRNQSIMPLACCFAGYVSVALLIAGLLLKRISSALKYKYRVNPSNAYFVGVDTVHTFQGRRLLLGSLWGRLRQPNYAGDLLALCSLALPLFLRFAWPPLICILLLCIVLLHRTQRVQVRNMSRYHSSWVRYCNKVRYYILPKVY